MSPTIRSFIAVELSPHVRARALDLMDKLNGTAAKVKWVEPENLHYTLVFLGDVRLTETAKICQAVEAVVRPLPPFEISAAGGAFPTGGAPRTVWLGVQQGLDEFRILHNAIQRALKPFGIREENRRYSPHITLGRVRGPQGGTELSGLIQEHVEFDAGTMFVDEITVFSSELTSDGPVYEPLAHIELAGK